MEAWFYLPEDELYTIFDSMADSVRFAVERTLTTHRGHTCSKSSFVDVEGDVVDWHDFGNLEGPGWAANAVGGAYELLSFGRFTANRRLVNIAFSILDHVLEDGFVDDETGMIIGYRDTKEKRLCLNFKHNDDWFCPGSMAKIAYQLLALSDLDPETERVQRVQEIAVRCAEWIRSHVKPCPNGWFPRRVAPTGDPYPERPEGGPDPIFEKSADGLLILQLMTDLTRRGLADYRKIVEQKARLFTTLGGLFGSINHDTYDEHENVSYAVGFRVLRAAADLVGSTRLRAFAYDVCLKGLDQFKMTDDRHGVRTRGLLFMEKSWDTAYLWENAEAALAYLEAYGETRSLQHLSDALTILRAAAKHHHGPYGFLTEGVDWNNRVGRQNHVEGQEFGDINYTEPLLNNLHITEPTLLYLESHATKVHKGDREDRRVDFYDFEGNHICSLYKAKGT